MDKEVRKFIKDEAKKMVDGDYDVLVSTVLKSKIGDEIFSEKIKKVQKKVQKKEMKFLRMQLKIPN
jgi:hypothetical protein